jgi:hypothetical protein
MSMTLEDLRQEWSDHSRRLDERLRLSAHVLRDEWTERQRERIGKRGPFGGIRLTVWIGTMALLGLFLGTHADQPALFFTAFILDSWVIVAGIAQWRQQEALRNLDFGLPLLELQGRLESLRIARIRSFNLAFLTGQVVWWIPFLVVVAGAFGKNLYLSPQFRIFATWNIAGGIAFIPLAIWLARRYGDGPSRWRLVRHIADSIAGRDLAAAHDYLEKLRRFGSE